MLRKDFCSIDGLNYPESYNEFLGRIFSFQRPEFSFGVERFESSESVKQKVSETGKFSRFIGDTVVFDLDDSQKNFIRTYYIDPLYKVAPGCLAEKLHENTLHMTLHDLNASACEYAYVMENMFSTEIEVAKLIREFDFGSRYINFETTCVFNMVNTSLVLGLKPESEYDYDKLMRLYQLIENIHQLPYRLTPHITLAYYCRDGFDGEQLYALQDVVNELNRETFQINFSTDRLYYQKFISMNEYYRIMCFNGK